MDGTPQDSSQRLEEASEAGFEDGLTHARDFGSDFAVEFTVPIWTGSPTLCFEGRTSGLGASADGKVRSTFRRLAIPAGSIKWRWFGQNHSSRRSSRLHSKIPAGSQSCQAATYWPCRTGSHHVCAGHNAA
jgi:hypothetical protein